MGTPLLRRSEVEWSADKTYRYRLTRVFDGALPPGIVFLMLNPSVADESKNDPTVERCERRAFALGFHAYTVLNLFAYRSTDPKALRTVDDPVGPENDATIIRVCEQASIIVCAWGNIGGYKERAARVGFILQREGFFPKCRCLGRNASGSPKHPLYVRSDAPLQHFTPETLY